MNLQGDFFIYVIDEIMKMQTSQKITCEYMVIVI
jgi:hypothetical protein